MEFHSQFALETKALARSFQGTPAVSQLDLQVRQGEMFGLVGPDGAGKSTSIRMLCGILRPTSGHGSVLGHDLFTQSSQIKAHIGYLSQNFTLYGDLSVDENIEFFAELHEVSHFDKKRQELLEFTRLTPFRKRLAHALSGGMKKKLALACTLVHTPKLIFLDEPSTGVDPVSRGEFWSILSGILEQGVTIFMTTPYLDEAERCHRISLMHQGKIIMTGTPDDIKSHLPGKMYNILCPDPSRAYRTLRKQWASIHLQLLGDRIRFWSADGDTSLISAMEFLKKDGFEAVQYHDDPPVLEDVFVALLGRDQMRHKEEQ